MSRQYKQRAEAAGPPEDEAFRLSLRRQLEYCAKNNQDLWFEQLTIFITATVVAGLSGFALYALFGKAVEGLAWKLSGMQAITGISAAERAVLAPPQAYEKFQQLDELIVFLHIPFALFIIGASVALFYLVHGYLDRWLKQIYRDNYLAAWSLLVGSELPVLIADEIYWGQFLRAERTLLPGAQGREQAPRTIVAQIDFCARRFDSLAAISRSSLALERVQQGERHNESDNLARWMLGCAALSCCPGTALIGLFAVLPALVFLFIGLANGASLQLRCRRAAICEFFLGEPRALPLDNWHCLLSEEELYVRRPPRGSRFGRPPATGGESVAQLMRRMDEDKK